MIHTMKKRPTVVAAARQAGLTLIELTIVLLILIGLSGLLLPHNFLIKNSLSLT